MLNLWGVLKGLLVQGETDRTKQVSLEVDEAQSSPNTRTTIKAKQSFDQTLELPDIDPITSDELVSKDHTQTITNKDMSGNTNIVTGAKADNLERETGNQQVVAIPDTTVADDVVLNDFAATLTQKSMDGDNNTFTNIDEPALKTNLTNANKFLVRDGAGNVVSNTKDVPTGAVVGTTDTQTLSGKSIDADNNTITNIDNADIKASAGIDATKIADGTVTNIEFQHLDGLGNNIQFQLDNRLDHYGAGLDNAVIKSNAAGDAVERSGVTVDDSDNMTVPGNLEVTGDLTVQGTTTALNSTTLDVEDANITVNNGGTQANADLNDSGITVEMSDATNALIGYDSTLTSKFKVGEVGSEKEIVTVSDSQIITNKDYDGGTVTDTNRLTLPADTETNINGLTRKAGTLSYISDLELLALDNGTDIKIIGEGDKVVIRGLIAGENLAQNDAVYVADGSDARTAGQVYKLDPSDDNRMEFIGIVEAAATASNECIIVVSGKVANFSTLTQGQNLYADYLNPGQFTQTEPSEKGTWSVIIGKAISVTEILVNADLAASAIFIENAVGELAIANNQTTPANVTNLSVDGSVHNYN